MSVIDYFNIEQELGDILREGLHVPDVGTTPITVEIEGMETLNTNNMPWIGIFLDSTQPEIEMISGGTQMRTYIYIEVVIYDFALDTAEAARKRDRLFSRAKEVLKGNRTLNSKVLMIWFLGADFETTKKMSDTIVGVSMRLRLSVKE